MPNCVDNNLTVYGEAKAVESLLEFIKDDDSAIDFNKICPIDRNQYRVKAWKHVCDDGSEYLYTDSHVGVESIIESVDGSTETNDRGDTFAGWAFNWYSAHNAKWGTKWNACDAYVTVTDCKDGNKEALMQFNTAWGAPVQVLEALCRKFPDLEIRYYCTEEGNGIFLNGDNCDGEFIVTEYDAGDVYTDEAKETAIRGRMADDGLDADSYDLEAIAEECSFCLVSCDYYDGFTCPELEVWDLPEDLEQFRKSA